MKRGMFIKMNQETCNKMILRNDGWFQLVKCQFFL